MPTTSQGGPDILGQLPFIVLILSLFSVYGVLVRRGVVRDRAILGVGVAVGILAVGITAGYWWQYYQRGLLSFPLFLLNPVAMALCSAWCVGLAYRSQKVDDIATYTVGDTKVIVRSCSPSRIPDADALILPTTTTLRMLEEVAGQVGMAAGREVGKEARAHGPVGMGKVVVTGAGRLAVGKIVHVAVQDYMKPVDATKLRKGVEQAAIQARKLNAESVVVPVGYLRGLTLAQTAEAIVGGVLKQRRSFAEVVVVVFNPRNAREVAEVVGRLAAGAAPAGVE